MLQQGPSPATTPSSPREQQARLLYSTALGALVICPLLALAPPRKLDVYTFGLIGATGVSANYVARERTGRSITQRLGFGPPSVAAVQDDARQRIPSPLRQDSAPVGDRKVGLASGSHVGQIQNQRAEWMVQREQEIREDVREGKSYGDMIIDQIREVWNGRKQRKPNDD